MIVIRALILGLYASARARHASVSSVQLISLARIIRDAWAIVSFGSSSDWIVEGVVASACRRMGRFGRAAVPAAAPAVIRTKSRRLNPLGSFIGSFPRELGS